MESNVFDEEHNLTVSDLATNTFVGLVEEKKNKKIGNNGNGERLQGHEGKHFREISETEITFMNTNLDKCIPSPLPRWESEEELYAFEKENGAASFLEEEPKIRIISFKNTPTNQSQTELNNCNEKVSSFLSTTKSQKPTLSNFTNHAFLGNSTKRTDDLNAFPLKCCDKMVSKILFVNQSMHFM